MRRGAIIVVAIAAVVATAAGGNAAGPVAPGHLAEQFTLSGLPPIRFPTRAAVTWCGAGQPTAADRKPEVDATSSRQVHVTYAVPADAADQLAGRATPIATDVEAIDVWWRGQDASRTPRFDLFAFPGCATKFGRLDIGFVRLPRVGSLYVGDAGADRLLSDLGALAALGTQKHLVYYDGPAVFEPSVCGTAFVSRSAPTQGGLSGIAFVWLRSACGFDLGAGGLAASVAAHELIHGLGSLISGSPNECDPPNDGHVCDATNDMLYPEATSQTTLATQVLDIGRDDYYGHPGTWFDVQDSAWLSHLPQLPLTVDASGRSGTVRITSPTAVECGRGCALELDTGTQVTLAAAPDAGSRFVGWSGACTGTGACTLTLDVARSVTARFAVATSLLLVRVSGKGTVVSSPAGVSCPSRCRTTFTTGVTVRLRAKPAAGFRFAGWSGACRGTGACFLPVDRNRSVRATFRKRA